MMLALLLALQADLADAIRKTRAETSYSVAFSSRTTLGRGDPLDREGIVRWWKAGVLLVDYKGSADERVQAVRAGTQFKCARHEAVFKSTACETCGGPRLPTALPRVWVHHPLGWLTADQAGKPAAASGFQNPDDLLAMLESQVHAAKPAKDGWILALVGKQAVDVARKLAPGNDFKVEKASLEARLRADQGRIVSLDLGAELTTADGTAGVTGSAKLSQFGELRAPVGLGTTAFSPDVAAAVAGQLR